MRDAEKNMILNTQKSMTDNELADIKITLGHIAKALRDKAPLIIDNDETHLMTALRYINWAWHELDKELQSRAPWRD